MPRNRKIGHGVRVVRGIQVRTSDPFQGLVAVPITASQAEISTAMREGRARMLRKHGSTAILKAMSDTHEHVKRINHRGARV